jgi:hypothetical protein
VQRVVSNMVVYKLDRKDELYRILPAPGFLTARGEWHIQKELSRRDTSLSVLNVRH